MATVQFSQRHALAAENDLFPRWAVRDVSARHKKRGPFCAVAGQTDNMWLPVSAKSTKMGRQAVGSETTVTDTQPGVPSEVPSLNKPKSQSVRDSTARLQRAARERADDEARRIPWQRRSACLMLRINTSTARSSTYGFAQSWRLKTAYRIG